MTEDHVIVAVIKALFDIRDQIVKTINDLRKPTFVEGGFEASFKLFYIRHGTLYPS